MAYTYLLLGDTESAVAHYSLVDSMAPRGFLQTKAALDCLERESTGLAHPGTYVALVGLEPLGDHPLVRRRLQALVKATPAVPQAWVRLGMVLQKDDQSGALRAFEAGLSHDPDPETRGGLLIGKALTLINTGKADEGSRILEELMDDPRTTDSVRESARQLLRSRR
jgi:hypothetical protein